MNKTSIEYLDYTWNPIAMRCMPVSTACDHCWHLQLCKRLGNNPKIDAQHRNAYNGLVGPQLIGKELDTPIRKKKPARIGVQFMGDLFYKDIAWAWINEILSICAQCEHHTFIILTKRQNRMADHLIDGWGTMPLTRDGKKWPLPNVHIGVTAENQQMYDERWEILQQIPAPIRWISAEPLLGPIDITKHEKKPDWFVVGGESGPGAHPMHPDWARSLRDQCINSGVPFFFKQWGDHPWPKNPEGTNIQEWVDAGYDPYEKKGGRELDGKVWDQYPKGI